VNPSSTNIIQEFKNVQHGKETRPASVWGEAISHNPLYVVRFVQ
jgi:hypothetical protein